MKAAHELLVILHTYTFNAYRYFDLACEIDMNICKKHDPMRVCKE